MEKDINKLIEKIKYLEPYLAKDVTEYLYALVNLEITVFSNEKYNEFLKTFDLFLDIACYNLYERSVKLIEQSKLPINLINFRRYLQGSYSFSYSQNNEYDFLVLNKSKDCKCNLYYHGYFDCAEELKKCHNSLNKLGTESRLFCKPSYLYSDILCKEDGLKERIKFLEEYGLELEELTDMIDNILLNDWNLEFNKHLKDEKDREIVKESSWCRVYKIK